MSNRMKFFVAILAAAMILVPSLASARRTLLLESRKFSGVNWAASNPTTGTPNQNANVLGVRITSTGMTFIENLVNGVLQDKVLANYLDCTVRQMLDNNIDEQSCGSKQPGKGVVMGCVPLPAKTKVDCKDAPPGNYGYVPSGTGAGPYEAGFLFNSCSTLGAISIPMVGTICLAIRIANIDPLASGDTKIIDFRQTTIAGNPGAGSPYFRMRALQHGNPHTELNTLDILVHLDSIQVDLKIEPPYGLTDIYPIHSDGSAMKGYDASQDYSNYVKAWGRITIPSVEVALSVRTVGRYDDYGETTVGSKSPHLRDLGLDLFGLYMDLGLEYVLVPGPYCNFYQDENSKWWDWSTKCGRPTGCATCPLPNITGDTSYIGGQTSGCNRANIDANWPANKTAAKCDDPVLPNSEMIADVIPFLDAHLTVVASNLFSGTKSWPYLDWYIGPTRIISLNPLLECLSIDNPLTIETDLIMVNMGFNTEFWADGAGLIIPGDFALDFQEYNEPHGMMGSNPASKDLYLMPMTSCVEVIAGYNRPITSMSRPTATGPECVAGSGCNNFINYGSELVGGNVACSAGDQKCPFMGNCPGGTGTFCNGSPAIVDYHIGIGVHQNMISSIIYDAITTGLLCLWIDKEVINRDLEKLSSSGMDISALLGSTGMNPTSLLGQLFTTDVFALMVPDLSLYWPSADMAIEIVPAVNYPRAYTTDKFTKAGPAPLSGYAGYANAVTNEPPYAKVGRLIANYSYAVPGSSITYHGPVTTNDLAIVIPHLNLNFYIYNKNGAPGTTLYRFNSNYANEQLGQQYGIGPGLNMYTGKRYTNTPLGVPMRAFGLDLGLTVGLDINLLNMGTAQYVFDFFTGNSNTPATFPRRQLVNGNSNNGDMVPGYHKLGYDTSVPPVGLKGNAGWNATTHQQLAYKFPAYTFPGGIQAQTGRVIDVTAIVDPEVRFYLEYYEAIPAWNPTTSGKYPDFYNDVLGNLLPTILSGMVAMNLSLGYDIGAMLNTPFAIDGTAAPKAYANTSAILNSNTGNTSDFNGTPGTLGKGAGIFPAGPDMDRLAKAGFASTEPIWPRDTSSGTDQPRNLGLGDPDWLGIFIKLNGTLGAKSILAIAAPLVSGFTGGGSTSSITSSFGLSGLGGGSSMSIMNVNVNDILGALGASLGGIGSMIGLGTRPACSLFSDTPPTNIDDSHNGSYSWSPCSPFSPAYWEVMSNYYPPETTINQPTAVDARGTLISFTATDDKDSDGQIRFSYRLDNGFWSPWNTQRYAVLKGLLEGQHLFEVRALDTNNNIEPTPAQMVFRVDSIPPTISLSGSVHGSSATFVADVRDFQTKPEEIQIAYRLDDGSWSGYSTSKKIDLAYLSDGTHTLGVKAMDKSGNEAIATQAFNVTPESTFGCSTVPTSGSALLLLLFVPGFLVLRKRIGR